MNQVEAGQALAPKFDAAGLTPVVTTDAKSGEVLMMRVMNTEALRRSAETGEAHYWSRSRQCLWHKGATSGLIQKAVELRTGDDQDAIWLRVEIVGLATCHVGYRSCFYRAVPIGAPDVPRLTFTESEKLFDPAVIYGDMPNPTQL
ncbi:phosphoribosyl-AMP cyclohydrolase [Paracoccus alkanivorans]|uniref:phosphoribosyl-AMP cyclohydrolase n=1 Tax=Paracoccus alkanivorans TaxID=2116655 RepID=UPI001FB63F29|nr:phosphoribosyl-AMP cyclohydrolase [Paracoccus alkanivorans]